MKPVPALRLLVVAAAASVLLAGCFAGDAPPYAGPPAHVTLTLPGNGTCPRDVEVRVTNPNDGPLNVSYGGFRITDARGTGGNATHSAFSYYPSGHFPQRAQLAKNESAEGHVTFNVIVEHPPYNLTYDRENVVGDVLLNMPANGTVGCTSGEGAPAVELSAGAWSDGNITFAVTRASPLDRLSVDNLTFVLANATGTVYYSGSSNKSATPALPTIRLGYWDMAKQFAISAGDEVRVSVVPATPNPLHGGSLKLFFEGVLVGEVAVP